MTKSEEVIERKEFFPDWKYEIINAKELGYLPHDCVCHISCISCGPDRIAYGSSKLSSVYFSEISTPSTHVVKLQFKTEEKMLAIEWLPFEPYHLLVVAEKNLFIIDTVNDVVLCQTEAIDLSVNFIDAHWTKNGNIISLSHKDAMTFYDSELKNHHQLSISNETDNDYKKTQNGEMSFCFAIDDDRLYVGQSKDVLIFDIGEEGKIISVDSFVAHPHNIDKIQILNNNIVTLSDKGAIIWDKKDLVPLYSIKCSGRPSEGSITPLFCADPTGTFGIDSDKLIFKLTKGKKSETIKVLDFAEPILAAAWQNDENENEKILHIGSYSQKEFCLPLVIKFTHL